MFPFLELDFDFGSFGERKSNSFPFKRGTWFENEHNIYGASSDDID
jgi:hypothetical protein